MEFRRLSKSLLANALKCGWYAHATHNLRHKVSTGPLGLLGRETHVAWADYHSKSKSLEQIRCGLSPEVGPLFNMALASDTMSLSNVQCEIKIETTLDDTNLIAILDRLGTTALSELVVEDLKTQYSVSDDPFERNFYVYMADRKYPANRIIFTRLYARSGQRTIYSYEKVKDHIFLLNDPDGNSEEINLEDFTRKAIETLRSIDPIPSVGPQCKDWFGVPCPFYQNLCPATSLEIETATAVIQSSSNSEASAAKALLNAKDPLTLPAETVSAALSGINKLKDGCKTVEKIIKTWSDHHGDVVTSDGIFRWHDIESSEIDNHAALLQMFLSQMPIEDIAKAVNISQTSLKRLPGKYKDIAQDIISEALSIKKTRRFQKLN